MLEQKKGGYFTPARLQAVGDQDLYVTNGVDRGELGEDITEVPCVRVANSHATESIFGVKFGKD